MLSVNKNTQKIASIAISIVVVIFIASAILIFINLKPHPTFSKFVKSKKITMALTPKQEAMFADSGYINFDWMQEALISANAAREAEKNLENLHAAEKDMFAKKKRYTDSLRKLNTHLPTNLFHKYSIDVYEDVDGYTITATAEYPGKYENYYIDERGVVAILY